MFEILEHPADIGFRTWGKTAAELFQNAAAAMVSVAIDLSQVSPRQEYPLAAAGEDYESLLVNWLSEILYWTDGRQIALGEFQVNQIDATRVSGIGRGEPRDPERHPAKVIVKAVTYHQLRVIESPDGWQAEVYLDI
jgi:SHS2 domain-containing protein